MIRYCTVTQVQAEMLDSIQSRVIETSARQGCAEQTLNGFPGNLGLSVANSGHPGSIFLFRGLSASRVCQTSAGGPDVLVKHHNLRVAALRVLRQI